MKKSWSAYGWGIMTLLSLMALSCRSDYKPVDRLVRNGYGSAMEKIAFENCTLSMQVSSRKMKDTDHISINMGIARTSGNEPVMISDLRLELSGDQPGARQYIFAGFIPQQPVAIELSDGKEHLLICRFFSTEILHFPKTIRLTLEAVISMGDKRQTIKKTVLFQRSAERGIVS